MHECMYVRVCAWDSECLWLWVGLPQTAGRRTPICRFSLILQLTLRLEGVLSPLPQTTLPLPATRSSKTLSQAVLAAAPTPGRAPSHHMHRQERCIRCLRACRGRGHRPPLPSRTTAEDIPPVLTRTLPTCQQRVL